MKSSRQFWCSVQTYLFLTSIIVLPVLAQFTITELPPTNPQQSAGFGRSIAAIGDVNGDGSADLLVGASSENVGGTNFVGRVYIISGQDGSEIYALDTPNPQLFGTFGFTLAAADLTNDGVADLLIGSQEDVNGFSGAGRVYAFNGTNGAFLYDIESPAPEEFAWFSRTLSGLSDINNDGYDDFAVGSSESAGAPASGRVYVFSGFDGAFIYSINSATPNENGLFSIAMESIRDVNSDGISDLLIGADEASDTLSRAGRVYVHSGLNGTLIYALESTNPAVNGQFGWSVTDAGDIDNDGTPDIAVGSEEASGGVAQSGRAYVFSGVSGNLLYEINPPTPDFVDWFSRSISSVGDITGDNKNDLLIGAPFDDVGATVNAGMAFLINGADGSILDSLASPNPQFEGLFGFGLSGDWNPGHAGDFDIIISAYREHVGNVLNAGKLYRFHPMDVSIDPQRQRIPASALLEQNYPNPFNPTTTIRWEVSFTNTNNLIRVAIYDVLGKPVRDLVNQIQSAGSYEIEWDSKNNAGALMPSGVYIYRLIIGNHFDQSRKMLLIR
ncbi:MAG: FG-GAP-like repeat-containing protein [Calditrichia bacterium]